ncbi:Origin recognition complex subunit 5 [Coniochaeta hoffmannii]|uniref:Origin recognition complex subunit 5 n=1 Tax=Coniochaeta hoffmannii TaxID=91930 RepID=A0AA38S6B1_9PEZI|nr:Origin recognition complex subunit 5 [Coniochaeta hoffmannii]
MDFFQLPDELVYSALSPRFPCRDAQIRTLTTLVYPSVAPCRNIVVHGTEATGKSAVTEAVLKQLAGLEDGPDQTSLLRYAIVNSIECITGRHLLERTIHKVADALEWESRPTRCETLSQLTVELSKMLLYPPQRLQRPKDFRFVLVFDAIDRQRETPPTLLPALARLSEIIPSLTTIFVVTSPPCNFLHVSSAPHIHFPNYTKSEFVSILSLTPPATLPNTTAHETVELWTRFTSAVHDALTRAAARTLPGLQHAASALWPRFTAPILAGTHSAKEFSKLLVASRLHFQDERLLDPGIVSVTTKPSSSSFSIPPTPGKPTPATPTKPTLPAVTHSDLTSLLPSTARLLLLASYLASHNASRHDLTLFSTHHHGRRRRRGGVAVHRNARRNNNKQHRKIARKLLGAHAFVLERMLAIFVAVRREWDDRSREEDGDEEEDGGCWGHGIGMDGDVGMAIATLASLRLLVRVGAAADVMDRGGKWRVNVGWEVVRGLGRSMGVEVEEWLVES